MSRLSEMKLYEIFDGEEIRLFCSLVNEHLRKLEVKKNKCEDNDIRICLDSRIRKLHCLCNDMAHIWSEMLKDGHYNDIRSKEIFIK